jgi:hypothetical protein
MQLPAALALHRNNPQARHCSLRLWRIDEGYHKVQFGLILGSWH